MNDKRTLNLLVLTIGLFSLQVQSKIYFTKDLLVNGTLKAQYGEFEAIQISKKCNVDDLLSVDALEAQIVDTKELYLDVLQPTNDTNKILIQGNLIIEDTDDSYTYATTSATSLAQKSKYARVSLVQIESDVLSELPKQKQQFQQNSNDRNWHQISNDDFNTAESINGWSLTQTSHCHSVHDQFLGGHCVLSSEAVFKTIDNLPPHNYIKIIATLHFIDKWEGESAVVTIDGSPKWLRSVKASEHGGINVCGGDHDDSAFNVPVYIESPHREQSIKIGFKTSIKEGEDPCNKSLGIDNVEVYIK